MPSDAEARKADLIRKTVAQSKKRLGKNAQNRFSPFLKAYYANVPSQDIQDNSPATLFALAHGHWKQSQVRSRRKALIRVFNPDAKKDGWQCNYTVIEIINDDMPFLVDSITAEINRQNLTVHLVIHPLFAVHRNKKGKISEILASGEPGSDGVAESFMHLQVTHLPGNRLKDIERGIKSVLRDVRSAVRDWRAMRAKLAGLIDELETVPAGVHPEEAAEIRLH